MDVNPFLVIYQYYTCSPPGCPEKTRFFLSVYWKRQEGAGFVAPIRSDCLLC
ncbi:hypothetical protein HMPREF0262_02673 [Clostridium sp. ATCC 29733]|nr:hypothetical protein HMPREF0262_02673 [Clostridium sp. ATCC 29733]